MLCAALAYYLLPDVKQKFKFITPGSVIGTLVWLLGTWGFAAYAGNFGSYNVTYGSIGGVIVLLTWFYISGFIFLMGGEMNAIIEHASPDGKNVGARAPGEAPPPPSERPSAMPAGAADSAAVAARSKGGVPADAQGVHR
jgi:membrane protein